MSERQEHRQRLNARIAYAAAIERWAKNQPSRIRFFAAGCRCRSRRRRNKMRLIDEDELNGKAFSAPDDGEYFVYCQDIEEAPTVDAVEVVRCRDCKFWEPYGSKAARNIGDPLERYGGCEIWHGGHLESDFCSYGQAHTNSIPLNQEERWLKTV